MPKSPCNIAAARQRARQACDVHPLRPRRRLKASPAHGLTDMPFARPIGRIWGLPARRLMRRCRNGILQSGCVCGANTPASTATPAANRPFALRRRHASPWSRQAHQKSRIFCAFLPQLRLRTKLFCHSACAHAVSPCFLSVASTCPPRAAPVNARSAFRPDQRALFHPYVGRRVVQSGLCLSACVFGAAAA